MKKLWKENEGFRLLLITFAVFIVISLGIIAIDKIWGVNPLGIIGLA